VPGAGGQRGVPRGRGRPRHRPGLRGLRLRGRIKESCYGEKPRNDGVAVCGIIHELPRRDGPA
ncbi:unnamed protein product, partial [Heterosigma akashiwo]